MSILDEMNKYWTVDDAKAHRDKLSAEFAEQKKHIMALKWLKGYDELKKYLNFQLEASNEVLFMTDPSKGYEIARQQAHIGVYKGFIQFLEAMED